MHKAFPLIYSNWTVGRLGNKATNLLFPGCLNHMIPLMFLWLKFTLKHVYTNCILLMVASSSSFAHPHFWDKVSSINLSKVNSLIFTSMLQPHFHIKTSVCECLKLIWKFSLLCTLGTHEAQACAVTNCSRPGIISISCNFSENSTAKGYLSILWSKSNLSQEVFVVANRRNMSTCDSKITVPRISSDEYGVVVYDLGKDHLPVLSDENNSYVLAAEEENVTVTTHAEATGKGHLYSGSIFSTCSPGQPSIANNACYWCLHSG